MKPSRAKRYYFVFSSVLAILFCSCINFSDLQLPENIKVKTNGNYSFAAGTQKNMLSEFINVETLHDSLKGNDTENKKISVYDYDPNSSGGTQQFLLKYDLPTIPLNMDETMKDINLDKIMVDGMSRKFKIDKPNLSFDYPVELNFNEIIGNKFSANIPSFPIVQMGTETSISVTDLAIVPSATFNASPSFTSARLTSGTLEIRMESKYPLPANYELELSAELYNGDTFVSGSGAQTNMADPSVGTYGGGVISIPLAGKTFSSDFILKFTGRTNGGVAPVISYFTATATLKDPVLAEIVGITVDDPSFSKTINEPIALGNASDYLVFGTIDEGSLAMELSIPESWKNITVNSNFSLEGALDIPNIPNRAGSTKAIDKYLDLAGKKITLRKSRTEANTLSVKGTVGIKLENATLVFSSENTKLNMSCKGDLKSLSEVYANASSFSFNDAKTQAPPSAMKQYVKEMKLTQIAIAANFNTTLDIARFDLTAETTSDVFHLYNADNTKLTGTTVVGDGKPLTMLTKNNWNVTIAVQDNTEFDFNFTVAVPGSYESTTGINCLHLKTFTLGNEYEIKVENLELDLDWEYIILKTDAIAPTEAEEIDTGLNLEKMISDFFNTTSDDSGDSEERKEEIKNIIDRINLAEVRGYLYVVRPDVSEDAAEDPLASLGNFNGKLYAKYKKEEVLKQEYLLGSETESEALQLLADDQGENTLDYATLADENYLITKDLFADSGKYSAELDSITLCDMVNAKPAELKFGYSFSISDGANEIRLTPQAQESLKGTKAITMAVVLYMPLKLHLGKYNDSGIKEGIAISDMMSLFGNPLTEDLLKRDESDIDPITDDTQIEKLSKMLKYVKLHYTFENNTGLKMSASLTATNKKGERYIDKNLYLDGDRHDVELSNSEIMTINNTYPFIPKIALNISPTADGIPINIQRNAFFSLSDCLLEFETDGEYTVKGDD
ncbi:MAG: hypothetical protein IKS40_04045 [Treponema sp.]|nr:hypothetical protein [Treponema sp.]